MAILGQAKSEELADLIRAAGKDFDPLISAYEPLERAYREATAPGEVVAEVVNTTTLPRALVTTAVSAR